MKLSCLLVLLSLSYFFNPIKPIVSDEPTIDLTNYHRHMNANQEEMDASIIEEQFSNHIV